MDYNQYLIPDDVEEVTLPSGMKAKLRHPGLNYYLGRGSLPGKLAAIFQTGGGNEQTKPSVGEMNASTILLLCDIFVEPRFTNCIPPEEGTHHISRLRIGDAAKAIVWATDKMAASYKGGGGGADLETFRPQPEYSDGNGAGGGQVEGAPIVLAPPTPPPPSEGVGDGLSSSDGLVGSTR